LQVPEEKFFLSFHLFSPRFKMNHASRLTQAFTLSLLLWSLLPSLPHSLVHLYTTLAMQISAGTLLFEDIQVTEHFPFFSRALDL
jgi:hypothetical protein